MVGLMGLTGVAISTTGDEHRMGFLAECVTAWRKALPLGSVIVVTVDGTDADAARAVAVVDSAGPRGYVGGTTWQVGPRLDGSAPPHGRLGVAANKNTGIEALVEAGVEHLFLCDDDTWPTGDRAVPKHTGLGYPHSMVCWGKNRLVSKDGGYATWAWPRGVLLYARRDVIATVGGMDEAFGPGGHEHVEWSQRIHNAGFTPAPFISPAVYAENGVSGPATRASMSWHCTDMRQPGEQGEDWQRRKRQNTSIRRVGSDWEQINAVMESRKGSSEFVPFSAYENRRASATLIYNLAGRAEEQARAEEPRGDA